MRMNSFVVCSGPFSIFLPRVLVVCVLVGRVGTSLEEVGTSRSTFYVTHHVHKVHQETFAVFTCFVVARDTVSPSPQQVVGTHYVFAVHDICLVMREAGSEQLPDTPNAGTKY